MCIYEKTISVFLTTLLIVMALNSTSAIAMDSKNYEPTSVYYFTDMYHQVFYDCPQIITTRTTQPDGTLFERFDYNLISNGGTPGLNIEHKVLMTGAYMTVNNIIKESEGNGMRTLFSYGPVTINFAGGPENYAGARTINKFTNYLVERGKLLYLKTFDDSTSDHIPYYTQILFSMTKSGSGYDANYETKTLTEPGYYQIILGVPPYSIGFFPDLVVNVCIIDRNVDLNDNVEKTANAIPSFSSINVNENSYKCPAYIINDATFIKVRDIAYMLNGTEKQFNVSYSSHYDSIMINNYFHPSYKLVGTEFATVDGKIKTATLSTQAFHSTYNPITPLAYIIDESNYVMLRDIAKIVDFGLVYDDKTNTIAINTRTNYDGSRIKTEEVKQGPPNSVAATHTVSTFSVNGFPTSVDCYTINDSTYLKLRDIAYLLRNTSKKFSVDWDNETQSISLTSGQAYKAIGGELKVNNKACK